MWKTPKGIAAAIAGAGMLFCLAGTASADVESDAILQVLVEKGVISEKEIAQIKQKVKNADEERGIEGKIVEKEAPIPKWVRSTKFKGDLRLRNEVVIDRPKTTSNINQNRFRLRFGFESQVNEKIIVALGLASGSSAGGTSTNQTLDNSFDKKSVWIDYAYLNYTPEKWASFTAGKFANPFFRTDMLWDSDLNLEGLYGKFSTTNDLSGLPTELYLTAGAFPIETVAYNTNNAASITMYAGQVGVNTKLEGIDINSGLAYYDFAGLDKGQTVSNRPTTTSNSTYLGEYKVLVPTLTIDFKDVIGKIDLGLLGEYSTNDAANTAETEAYRIGAWIGDKKIKKEGDWQILGQYSEIQQNAFVDAFPDADFIAGRTNGKGYEWIAEYGFYDNVVLGLDYYEVKTPTTGVTTTTHKVIQTDVVVKF